MLFQGIFTIFIFLAGFYALWKLLIEPRLPEEVKEPEDVEILKKKKEKLEELRREYQNAIAEREVTEESKKLDEKIDFLLKEIKSIEND